MAGLLLLLEAGQGAESFEAARRGLNPPQAPALGSSREADLTLLAALACQASAEDYRKERRYEAAAQTLQLGLQLLQRMGQLPASRQAIERSLAALLPYRILDLLSRDLAAVAERQEGLQLLEQLVQQRGGLDGQGDPDFNAGEFQAFFKQIRQFLTVQEQVDLFSHWAVPSSPTAGFLASYALTASGFSQRKPERIASARERLAAGGQSGMEPYLACLSLLLGQVETAQTLFAQGANEELRRWAAEQGRNPWLASAPTASTGSIARCCRATATSKWTWIWRPGSRIETCSSMSSVRTANTYAAERPEPQAASLRPPTSWRIGRPPSQGSAAAPVFPWCPMVWSKGPRRTRSKTNWTGRHGPSGSYPSGSGPSGAGRSRRSAPGSRQICACRR
ncbi:hypothetical protein [Cyanobium sp. ATX-6F1]|uniref:hypothetical protein n=1 Tax=Cyanobium sp. ATX-6F1 TaxID=3137388 RepID=UPI0039BDAD22